MMGMAFSESQRFESYSLLKIPAGNDGEIGIRATPVPFGMVGQTSSRMFPMGSIIYQTLRLDETLLMMGMAFSESQRFESYSLLKIPAGNDGEVWAVGAWLW
ncbi:hypothetical protein QVD17_30529 [Tagetes erecta]|uniref:Uncharacterized protein n=1 Tax=Tagetes erecta TaxID=13708 RepID=A0AAD8K210_TARER|nr:hypothetical protein QVD17_30529 [Tagetes erecta]